MSAQTYYPLDHLPHDPAILVSSINMLLRDEEFDTLEALCYNFDRDPARLKEELRAHGFVYSEKQHQFRPEGYDAPQPMPDVPRSSVETAYCFLHQKLRVYEHSTLSWQRDDIEQAIAAYVDEMNPALYAALARGRADYLRRHSTFAADMSEAVDYLENQLQKT
jgi:hypothetical protein